jgi:hypothetical protein
MVRKERVSSSGRLVLIEKLYFTEEIGVSRDTFTKTIPGAQCKTLPKRHGAQRADR